MKTTVDIPDELLAQAERYAKKTGQPLDALVEDGLHRVLSTKTAPSSVGYQLPDCSVGDDRGPDPIKRHSWAELRSMIYGEESQDWTP